MHALAKGRAAVAAEHLVELTPGGGPSCLHFFFHTPKMFFWGGEAAIHAWQRYPHRVYILRGSTRSTRIVVQR